MILNSSTIQDNGVVVFDKEVNLNIPINGSYWYEDAEILGNFEKENALHGIGRYYLVMLTCSGSNNMIVYPLLTDIEGHDKWPRYGDYNVSTSSKEIYSLILGTEFTTGAPMKFLLYSEGAVTLNVTHITIQVIR